jgi:hypothetical protein
MEAVLISIGIVTAIWVGSSVILWFLELLQTRKPGVDK